MSVLTQHPGRVVSLAFAAMTIAALAFNGPVAAGESADATTEPAAGVSETVGDVAPMVEPLEDVDESDASGDMAPMVEPMEDVDESDASSDVAPMAEPMEDTDE
jgi:hypothetical protein